MIELRTPAEIDEMQAAGSFVARVLSDLREWTAAGASALDIDARAHAMIREAGAESCYIDYAPSFGNGPFGKVICVSINDAVLHGQPAGERVSDGDLVSLDFAINLNGWVADSAISFIVGEPRPQDLRLIEATERALDAGIGAAQPGGRLGDISAAIGAIAADYGYDVNLNFGGHGVGRTMHQEPHLPNDGRAGRGMKLKPGLVLAIEPWFMETTSEVSIDTDGWTVRSADGSRGAHSEHTIAITEDGPRVLTARG